MEDEQDAQTLHGMRATAKRRHTNLMTQVRTMLTGNASREDFDQIMPTIEEAYNTVSNLHARFVRAADLDENEQHAQGVYLNSVNNRQNACVATVAAFLGRRVPNQGWNASNTGLAAANATVPLDNEPPNPQGGNNNETPIHEEGADAGAGDIDRNERESLEGNGNNRRRIYVESSDEEDEILNPLDFNFHNQAKRQKLDLEFQLEQQKIKQARDVADLELKNRRATEDLELRLRQANRVLSTYGTETAPLSSTMNTAPTAVHHGTSNTPLQPLNAALGQQLLNNNYQPVPTSQQHSTRYAKWDLATFNGNARLFLNYERGVVATIAETNMQDSMKLLKFQSSMDETIQKRMAHLFKGQFTFAQAWVAFKQKYGEQQTIIQAHDLHLAQLPSFRIGDFNGLFDMSSAVRDAVSSVQPELMMMFNTVINQLVTKLPNVLQADWGRYAHGLRRIPTLKDFDDWIESVLAAEELRGKTYQKPTNSTSTSKPASSSSYKGSYSQPSSSSSGRYGGSNPGSSDYAKHGPTVLTQSLSTDKPYPDCPCCKATPGHRLEMCNVFKRMIVNARAKFCADNNHCFKCLIPGHYGRRCQSTCKDCNGPHHATLHGAERQFPPKGNETKILTVRAPTTNIRPVLLAIVPLVIETKQLSRTTLAVLDPGSEATLVTRSLADLLQLSGPPTKINFGSFHNSVQMQTTVVSFNLKSVDNKFASPCVDAYVVPSINLSSRKINWPEVKQRWSHLSTLDLPEIDSSKVEILVGMDVSSAHETFCTTSPSKGEDGPKALKGPFGWAVVGKIPIDLVAGPSNKRSINLSSTNPAVVLACLQSSEVNHQSIPKRKQLQQLEDQQMVNVLKQSICFIGCGYQIELPLRTDIPVLPNNRNQALSRFYSTERRLLDPQMKWALVKYEDIIDKLISSGTAVLVPTACINKPEGGRWYLPHFFVVYPNKPHKIRVVFDAACKYKGISYNDLLLRGPPSIPSLAGVLLRARQYPVALTADVTAFYHRIGVADKHQSFQRFVYRRFGSNEPPKTYQFATLIFGAVCSSSAAVFTLQHAANQCAEYPQVAAKMKDNFYSDNMIDSFETEKEAIEFAAAVRTSLERGGFSLTAFASSSRRVLSSIPSHHRSVQALDLNLDDLPVEYQLGMEWDFLNTDSYSIRTKKIPPVTTRRELISAMSLTFDPLGICLPLITRAKLLFQQSCRLPPESRGWDNPLPANILAQWKDYAHRLESTEFPCVKRCFRPSGFPLTTSVFHLVIFSDASLVAYGAVAYLRVLCDGRAHSSFVMGKGRLAPANQVSTIPRLELQAATLALRLSLFIKQELRIPVITTDFYTDSQIVLHQLQDGYRGKSTFVTARRDLIRTHSSTDQWHFVKSEENPADDCTRGTASNFGPNCRWVTGPPVLMDPSYVHPPFTAQAVSPPEEEETKSIGVGQTHVAPSTRHQLSAPVSKLIAEAAGLSTLKRQVALLLRSDPKPEEEIGAAELAEAFRVCLLVSQQEVFDRERAALSKGKPTPRDSVLKKVGPYLDQEDGLLKVDGRLEHAELPPHTRHPIIIAPDHPLTRLVITDCHLKVHHSGVEHTLSVVRQHFYLPQGRRAIRRALANCLRCKILRGAPQAPRMASLPKERLQGFVRPFTNVGLDCFGPFKVVIGRKSVKRWG